MARFLNNKSKKAQPLLEGLPLRTLKIRRGTKEFWYWLTHLFSQPVFIFVTLWGHFAIICGAFAFHYFEREVNVKAQTWLNSYYWAISVATTVGSDIAPITAEGKLVAIAMMIVGALFLWSYTALFAAGLVASDVRRVEEEMEELGSGLKQRIQVDHKSLQNLSAQIELLRKALEKSDENRRI